MRAPLVLVAALALFVSCAPTRAELFGPVGDAARGKTGVQPAWRAGWQRPAAASQRVAELLARPLTADAAAEIAILASAELQAAYAELGEAGGELAAARALPNPEAELEVRVPLAGGETQLETGAMLNLTSLIALAPRGQAADAGLRASRRRAVAATVALAARARVAFYRAAAAEQLLALRRTIAEAATASAVLARSLDESGGISAYQLAREEVFEAEAALDVREAESDAAAARERVNAVLGLSGDETGWRLDPTLPDPPGQAPDASDLEREAVAASLDLDAARWRIRAAGHRVGAARLDSFLPDLAAGVAAQREGEWSVGPAVSLSIPLFDWGQGKRAAAWAALEREQHAYTAMAVELRAAARAARERLAGAHERASRIRRLLMPLREKLLDEAVLQYNAMNLTPFELLVLRREQIASEERYIAALRDYWIAQAHVDQLRAGSLPREDTP